MFETVFHKKMHVIYIENEIFELIYRNAWGYMYNVHCTLHSTAYRDNVLQH